MAKQIEKKWIADGAIDGSKIKLLEGQSLVIEVAGQPVELLKLNQNGTASLPQGEVPSSQAVDSAIATQVTALNTQIQSDIQSQISAETQARQTAIQSVEQSVQSAQTDISGIESDLAQEILDRQSGDSSTLSSAQSYTDQKVADLVNSAPSALNTLKELSDALGSDPNFATTVSTQIGTISSGLSSEITTRAAADSALQSSVSSLQAADVVLGGRLDSLETINGFIRGSLYNDSLGVYGSAQPGVEDPSALTRDGWYYQNTVSGQGISWYFHDGVSYPTTKAQLKNTFAVMTFDDKTAKPIFGVYSTPTGSNDVMPGFAHSKWVFQVPTASMTSVVLGKKYLVYAGDVAPTIHPELPRLQATFVAGSSSGQMLSSENISTIALISDGAVAVNKVKWLVESVGIHSDAFKYEGKLVIRHGTKAALDAEVSARTSANTAINSALALKAAITYVDSQDASKLVEAKAYADSKDALLDAKITTEKGRVDAILSASEADKDSFAEIVALINSVDTTNDQAFAGYVASNNAAVALKADKTYVDTGDALKVSKSGDSMSGKLTLNAGLDVTGRIEINDVADGTTFVFEPSLSSFEVQNNTILPGYVSVIQPGQIVTSLLNEEGTESLGNTSVEPGLINLWGAGSTPAVATEPQHAVNKQYVDQAIAAIPPVDLSSLESADAAFDSRISALENAPEAVIFEEDVKFVVDGININSTHITLPHLAKAVLKVGVNRLNAYKNQDYTVSVVGGVTRLTWSNDLAANGLSEIAGGDVIYVSYAR